MSMNVVLNLLIKKSIQRGRCENKNHNDSTLRDAQAELKSSPEIATNHCRCLHSKNLGALAHPGRSGC
jgi:hypothetical protein